MGKKLLGFKEHKKSIFCNVCGKQIKYEQGMLMEDILEVQKEWGYFSNKDLEIHHFNICEDCYNKLIATFAIPVQVKYKNEAL